MAAQASTESLPRYEHRGSLLHRQARQRASLMARAEELSALYRRLQRRLRTILDSPRSRSGDLLAARASLRAIEVLIRGADRQARDWLERELGFSVRLGIKHAGEQLRSLGRDVDLEDFTVVNRRAVERAARDTFSDLAGRTRQIRERLTFAIRDKDLSVTVNITECCCVPFDV